VNDMSSIEGITREGEILPIPRALGLRGRVLRVGWELPDDLSEDDWRAAGELLGKVERSVSWWIGDWWVRGEREFRGGREIVESETWEGPDYKTILNTAVVCKAVPISRRRDVLSFKHHVEVVALPPDQADALLDWAEETIPTTGKPRSTRELRGEVSRRRPQLGAGPSSETCSATDLHALVAAGTRFGCIYADPPWLYDNQGTRAATGMHYGGMTVDELCALPVKDLAADDAHLHLWTTTGFLRGAFRIFDVWGFEFRSSFVWVKPTIGIGNYWRNSHEFLLTAIRGNAKRFNDRSLRSWFECARGEHSAKPEQVRAMIERASSGPYLEMFGRLPGSGWTVWGNQIERNLFMQVAAE
jgi:N6-adenosine-specific RNA methylase IME4